MFVNLFVCGGKPLVRLSQGAGTCAQHIASVQQLGYSFVDQAAVRK